ncbi:Peptide deformylase [Buchnera aphidicola (Periphyllus testudinaceus)]|uniref:peptide deformylase n=1 Tax=Buchnera aphidicola TaxID=9 RepID=UPI003463E576
MSILKILKYPNIKLRNIAKPVTKFNKNLKKTVNDMFETMNKTNGIGLAAIQVQINRQIIIIDKIYPLKKPLVLINPKILKQSGKIYIKEGCLSIPKYEYITNSRSKFITVKAFNIFGKKIILHAKSILSVCIQHEIDHLKGILFIDYLSPLKRNRIEKKIKKNEK